MRRDYLLEMVEDVKDYIKHDCEVDIYELEYNRGELEEKLYDDLFVSDSVTGNASGSYYCNSYKSREKVIDSLDLLKEACSEFDCMDTLGEKFVNDEWEWMDVTIRCYLLGEAISAALDDIEYELQDGQE